MSGARQAPALLLLLGALLATLPAAEQPPAVIVDTDMLTDCDDAGALALLHALADQGEARILGMVLNGQDTHGKHGAVVSAINTFFHRGELPIGVCKRPADSAARKASSYSRAIFAEFPHDGLTDDQRPDAVAVYRRLLAAAPDRSVTIVSIGFLTNLDSLLASPGDALDARDGVALVRAKVKALSLMGGKYPAGKEYNLSFAPPAAAAARRVIATWPDDVAPVVFSGFELGAALITGKTYQQAPPSPMRRCYELAYDSLRKGRPSWDQVSTLYAVRGAAHGVTTYWNVVPGANTIDEQGANAWTATPARGHGYLVKALDEAAMAAVIEDLMTRAPGVGGDGGRGR
jgi:inosine-uridine nucleoside N-ribohydrolase